MKVATKKERSRDALRHFLDYCQYIIPCRSRGKVTRQDLMLPESLTQNVQDLRSGDIQHDNWLIRKQ